MATQLKIDFVSDVSCPWCVIGLKSLETALAKLKGEIAVDLHFQPFELKQEALKNALFSAYFTESRNPSDHAVLLDVAQKVGLDAKRAAEMLESDEFSAEVRGREKFYADRASRRCPP
jgi:predicted DsbA family dithiol-disulfide isomerase